MNEISDSGFRIQFFELFYRIMARIILDKENPHTTLFTQDETEIIEYFIREISPESTSVHKSKNYCIEAFRVDLEKISKGDSEKITVYQQALDSSKDVLDTPTILHVRIIFGSVLQKKPIIRKGDDWVSPYLKNLS